MTATTTRPSWSWWPVGYGEHLSRGQWWAAPHLELLGARIVSNVYGTGPKRLIVTMPPRHGKSELVDVWTPTWLLDLDPRKRVMLTTYGAEFAQEWGGKVRDVALDPGLRRELNVRIKHGSEAQSRWRTTRGGGLYTAGVGGPLTGRGADLLIIDDPHKNWEEASSKVIRDRIWNWWLTTARTRLEPGATVVVVMTRWHEDDFVGRLLSAAADDPESEQWEVVNLPAIAEADDALGRAPGEPLWPDRYDAAYFATLERTLGPFVFGAMYQQHPSSPVGTILQRGWWRYYEGDIRTRPIEQWLGSVDCTFKDADDSDFVVMQVWARIGADKFLVDQVRDRMNYPTTRDTLRTLAMKWPQVTQWIVEDKANGSAVIAELRNQVGGLTGYNPQESKEARAHSVSGHVESGNVWLPAHEPFTHDFVDECAAFPHGTHDDQVDAFTQAMRHMGVGTPIVSDAPYVDARAVGRR